MEIPYCHPHCPLNQGVLLLKHQTKASLFYELSNEEEITPSLSYL